MASTNNTNYVKFTYFHDTESPRTVTAARLLDGDKMYIEWCCNRMVRLNVAFVQDNYIPRWKGDVFSKDIARKITRGRLEQRNYHVVMHSEERKLEQMIIWLLENTAEHIAMIIHNAIVARKQAARGTGFSTAIPVTLKVE